MRVTSVSTLRRLARTTSRLLAVCAIVVGWTSHAWSDCGDYLQMPRHLPSLDQGAGAGGVSLPQPCDGPGCRRSRGPSSPLPASVAQLPQSEQAVISSRTTRPPAGAIRSAGGSFRASSVPGYPAGLERPPQFA